MLLMPFQMCRMVLALEAAQKAKLAVRQIVQVGPLGPNGLAAVRPVVPRSEYDPDPVTMELVVMVSICVQ